MFNCNVPHGFTNSVKKVPKQGNGSIFARKLPKISSEEDWFTWFETFGKCIWNDRGFYLKRTKYKGIFSFFSSNIPQKLKTEIYLWLYILFWMVS